MNGRLLNAMASPQANTPIFPRLSRPLGLALAGCAAVVVSLASHIASAETDLEAGVAAEQAGNLAEAQRRFATAAQGEDDRTAADALYLLGEADELALDFPGAIAAYDASTKRLPSGRYAPRANRRATELRGHAEGEFSPLVRLETLRRSPTLSSDPAAIDALVREAAAFPPGKVRVEARMLAADAYAGRLRRPHDALPLLEQVAHDPTADVLMARAAANQLLRDYIAREDFASALALTETSPKLLEPTAHRDVVRAMRRPPLRKAAVADLAILVLFSLLALLRPSRTREAVLRAVKRVAPMTLAFATLASGAAGFLASRYEQTSPYPFTAMLPAMFLIGLLARVWSAGGSSHAGARAVRAIVAFAGVFAAAFLLLDRMDPAYLAGFGL